MVKAPEEQKVKKWLEEGREIFGRELAIGLSYEDKVARHLEGWGFPVLRPQTLVEGMESEEERRDILSRYGDIVVGPSILDGIHLEVKSRRVHFTSHEDYPYQTVFVDTLGSRRLRTVDPIYVIVSQHTGAIVWVPRGVNLTPRKVWDRVRDIPVVTLEVHRGHLRPLEELREYLKAHLTH